MSPPREPRAPGKSRAPRKPGKPRARRKLRVPKLSFSKPRLISPATLTMAAMAVVMALYAIGTPILDAIELNWLDLRFRTRGPIAPAPPVVLAVIDEKSLETVGRWPWPRSRLAELVDALSGDGAKAVGFDVTFAEPDQNSRLELVRTEGARMNEGDTRRGDVPVDIALVVLLTALSFGSTYQPYFFGDELAPQRLAIQHGYSFWPIFRDLLDYKPLFVFYGLEAMLAKWQASRGVHGLLVAACMVWINVLLYGVVRTMFSGGRVLAWLVIATVLTSRYGVKLYYDYLSGLIELLSTALLLSALLAAWRAWRAEFNWPYAEDLLYWQKRAFREWAFRPAPIITFLKGMNTWAGFKSAMDIGLQTLGWLRG